MTGIAKFKLAKLHLLFRSKYARKGGRSVYKEKNMFFALLSFNAKAF
jgi:hypothetical protein